MSGQYVCLRHLNPLSIRRKAVLVEQARVAVDVLRDDPRDEVAQGSLGEAVDGAVGTVGLDELLLPTIGYDRRRFGMPSTRDIWVDAVRAEFHRPQPPQLPIRTERLTLRRAVPADAPATARAWADADFAEYLLNPSENTAEVTFENYQRTQAARPRRAAPHARAWRWSTRGRRSATSCCSSRDRATSCMEIGWTLHPWAAGRGLATEGARAMLRLAFEHYGVRRVVANLDALNERSAAMCERLGMRREVHRLADFWSKGRWTDSYEYAILRSEWEAQQD